MTRLLYLVSLLKFYDLSAQYCVSWHHVQVRDSDSDDCDTHQLVTCADSWVIPMIVIRITLSMMEWMNATRTCGEWACIHCFLIFIMVRSDVIWCSYLSLKTQNVDNFCKNFQHLIIAGWWYVFLVGMGGLRTEGGSQNCLGPQLLTSNSLLFVVFSFVVRVDIAETMGHDRGLESVKNFLSIATQVQRQSGAMFYCLNHKIQSVFGSQHGISLYSSSVKSLVSQPGYLLQWRYGL